MKNVFDQLLPDDAKKIIQRNRDLIQTLKKQYVNTISSQLNRIDKYEYLLDNKRIVHSGDILYRPLENFKAGQYLEMYHYGIVFGLSKKSEKLVLEISSRTDISIKSLKSFIKPYSADGIHIKKKPKNIKFADIIIRADTLIFESYSTENLNCEQFANYCVFNKKESKGLQNAAVAVSQFINLFRSLIDLKLAYTPQSNETDNISKFNHELKDLIANMKKLK
jgi:hypothetical protein